MMTDKEQVVQALRATLLSVKGALTLDQCNRDYKALQGNWIPYKKLGYQSLEQLFVDVPGFETKLINGTCYVDAIPTQQSAHIVSLISRQKSSKKTKANFQSRFPRKQDSWRKPASADNVTSSYNNQYSRQYYSPKNVPLYNNNYANKVNSRSYKTSEHVVKHPPEQSEKRSILKKSTAPVSKTSSQPLADITQSITTVVNSNNSETKTTTKNENRKVSAAQRMLHLREKLNVVDTIPLQLPAIDNECLDANLAFTEPLTNAGGGFDLEPPPETAPSVEKLEWTCKRLQLDEPIYKVRERRLKHEPLSYDCTVKVGNSYSASSYPRDCSTQDEAKEVAALKLLTTVESSESGGLPIASDEQAMTCLTTLVSEYDAGLWASTIPHLYREKFRENLPTNWQDLVESYPGLLKEKLVNGLVIHANSTEEEPLIKYTLDEYYDNELPPLQFPEENYWNVFVTVANSPLEVWVRIIGAEYSEASEKVNIAMNKYYSVSGNLVERTMVVENMWYAANVEDCGWQRAKVLEVEGDNVCVFLGDHGDDEVIHYSKLKILEPQFRILPSQAILCRLEGVEELATSSIGADIVRRLVGETLVAEPGPRDDPTEPTVSVVLYDTSTTRDLNLNKEIIQDFCISGAFNITQKLCEVEVGCITEEGRVWVSRAGGAATVRAALAMLTSPGPYRRPLPTSPQAPSPNPNALYIVRTLDGDWVRCIIISELDSEGTVRTQLVDSGLILRAPLSSLVPLQSFSPALNAFPRQAVQVRLGPAERAAGSMVGRLRELLLDNVVLCRAIPSPPSHPIGAPPNVELFVRIAPQNMLASVNNSIIIEYDYLLLSKPKEEESQRTDHVEAVNRKKERIFTRSVSSSGVVLPTNNPESPRATLPAAVLPAPGKCFDLYISMAANPWNFVVQSNSTRPILQTMMASLQIECPKLTESDHPAKPASGELYTVFYDKDGSWYRVVVAGVVSADMVSVYFCDYGDLAVFPGDKLRPVPSRTPLARTLPPQAIKARLFDIKPLHKDWSVEDCLRFQELCVEQQFVGVCKKVERDPLNPTEPLLTLELIDTSTDEDVYLNKQLVAEGRARLEFAP